MKKKIVGLILALTAFATLAACSSTCKEPGCDLEAYKSGYCELHYGLHALEQLFS